MKLHYSLIKFFAFISARISAKFSTERFKISKIIPFFNSGKRDKILDYRPISILPVLSKVFEKLVYTRLGNFLYKHHILTDHQFGLKSKLINSDAITKI